MESDQSKMKFRPMVFSGRYRLKIPDIGKHHYITRKYHKKHYIRVGSYLHYLADHAPLPKQKQWQLAFKQFCKLHPKF